MTTIRGCLVKAGEGFLIRLCCSENTVPVGFVRSRVILMVLFQLHTDIVVYLGIIVCSTIAGASIVL